jgi:hypothetical protein
MPPELPVHVPHCGQRHPDQHGEPLSFGFEEQAYRHIRRNLVRNHSAGWQQDTRQQNRQRKPRPSLTPTAHFTPVTQAPAILSAPPTGYAGPAGR